MSTQQNLTPFDVLRQAPERLTFHLLKTLPAETAPPQLADLVHADFPGYSPKPADKWGADLSALSGNVCARESVSAWQADDVGAGLPQTIRGWAATWEPTQGQIALFCVGRLAAAHHVRPGAICELRASIALDQSDVANSGIVAIVAATAAAYFREALPMLIRGDDRRLLVSLKQDLERVARRDSDVLTLSERSRRNATPVIPAGDAELVAAVQLLANRVNTLLAL